MHKINIFVFFFLLLSACNRTSAVQVVQIQFVARAGEQPINCTQPFALSDGTTMTLSDLRLFVHDVQLLTSTGEAVPVKLLADGQWQTADVVLLDFEDGSGSCQNGNVEQNHVIYGEVPAGDYPGLRLTVGVPFAQNHADPTRSSAPLSYTSLHWSWQGGYKFLRFDAHTATGQTYIFHLGSTACQGTIGNISGCNHPNRPQVVLKNFDSQQQKVVLDIANLLNNVNVNQNTAGTPTGCMSGTNDPDCKTPFQNLGLSLATGETKPDNAVFYAD